MTVNELLTLIDSLYPNGETNATKVMYMNIALHTMAPYFGDVYEDVTLVTVADQDRWGHAAARRYRRCGGAGVRGGNA